MHPETNTILVGIDEAGYGPILGPLVLSAAAFELPPDTADRCLWQVLRHSIRRSATGRDPRIAILDSKKLHKSANGIARLERSVLAVTTAARGLPQDLRTLLGILCPDSLNRLHAYPWYRGANPNLPIAADPAGIRIAAQTLRRNLEDQAVRLAGCWSEILLEGHYNRMVGKTRNKAVVLLGLVLRLIQRISDAHPHHALRILIDKQGARSHYGPHLMRAFEDRRLKVIEETDGLSVYELVRGTSRWEVSFSRSGDDHHLPIALASLYSKYQRELLMHCFNRFWSQQAPDVSPTAGYYQDGMRFLKQIQPRLSALGIDRADLIRSR
ncbi:MAG: hypothetical protein ACE5EQ_08320 [Phycisphaerae bacterium]